MFKISSDCRTENIICFGENVKIHSQTLTKESSLSNNNNAAETYCKNLTQDLQKIAPYDFADKRIDLFC